MKHEIYCELNNRVIARCWFLVNNSPEIIPPNTYTREWWAKASNQKRAALWYTFMTGIDTYGLMPETER